MDATSETDGEAVARLRATAHPVRLRILEHSLQCATRAHRDGRDERYVTMALLHDIGELVVESREKIRGGVAKRYRYDATRELSDRTSGIDDRIAYARANAVEVA